MSSQELAVYRLLTLGGLSLAATDGRRTPGTVVSRRGLALLALLAAVGERGIGRDKILAFLWPESDAERARHSLNQVLYALRRDLHSDSVVLGASELRLNTAHIGSDIAEFNRAIASGELERAVSAYAGPFLDGFFLSDAPEFERWTESERTRVAAANARALETLAQRAAAGGDHVAAVAYWRRFASADPLNDRVARQLMTAMLSAGDRVSALQYGESFRALLREELGVEPDSALLKLIERVRGEQADSTPSNPSLSRPAPETPSAASSSVPPRAEQSASPPPRNRWSFFTPPKLKRRRLKIAVVGGVVALTLGLSGVALLRPRTTPAKESRRVLVPAFENQTEDPQFDALGMMSADWIVEALTRSQLVDVVDAATALAASRPTTNGGIRQTPLSAKELADKTGATLMVVGTYRLREGAIEIDAAISDLRNGKELRRIPPVVVSQWSLQSGIATVRQRVLAELAPILNPGLRAWATAGELPPSYAAYREYLVGLDLRWRDAEGAVLHFRRAIELDTNFVRTRIALLDLYVSSDLSRADSVAAEADKRRDRLALYDRYVLDFLEAQIRGDHAAAYESSMLALETMPGSPLALRRAAYAAIDANHPRRTVELLTRLDPGLGGCSDCEYYWWALTSAEHMLGDYEQELADADRGIAQYPTLLPMRFNAIRALAALGREEDVERRVEAASALHARGWFNQLILMNVTAAELRAHGADSAAQRIIQRGLDWYAALPVELKRSGQYDMPYGATLYLAHRWREAEVALEKGAAPNPGNAYFDGWVAVAAMKAGDDKTVKRLIAELELPQGKYEYGASKAWLGRLAGVEGDRARAVVLLREAFREGREYNVYLHAEPYLESLRGYAPFEELMRPQG